MTGDVVISVKGLSKCYHIYEKPRDRLLQNLWRGRKRRYKEFWALRDVSFEVRRGAALGIIGRNGSGKSTLLQILTGIMTPTAGAVEVNGRVAALLELGSGFNPEFSGRENVYVNGAILGVDREQIDAHWDEIVAFAEIGDFIDQPVKEYSSGMMLRLAFSVQTEFAPEVLIVDEALSVGDLFFQQKCFARLRALQEKGLTLLFVSHDMGAVQSLCNKVIYLRQGVTAFQGETHVGIRMYLHEKPDEDGSGQNGGVTDMAPSPAIPGGILDDYLRHALWAAPNLDSAMPRSRILCFVVEDMAGKASLSVRIGEKLKFSVVYQVVEKVPVHVSIVLKNRYNQIVNCTSTYTLGMDVSTVVEGNVAVFELEMSMALEAGQYTFFAGLGVVSNQPNQGENIDETPWLGPILITWDFGAEPAPFLGMFGLPAQAKVTRMISAEGDI